MRAEDWPRFSALLDEALELTPEQRPAWLAGLEEDAASLRAELEDWLRDDASSRGFLEAPLAPGTSWERRAWVPHAEGRTVGRYSVVRVIGVGGTSVVYEAVQEEPRRRVALKVFRADLASERLRTRFADEASILAGLRHPAIAQVFEAGTDDTDEEGSPWIAMELVAGARPVTHYAREAGLTRAQRLEFFTELCDAVAHGHERGVIHTDLKPANLLVDESGRAKVIDFGVARMLGTGGGQDADAASERTDSECNRSRPGRVPGVVVGGGGIPRGPAGAGTALGTVPWMSPERFAPLHALPDTRADVYALGVVLHELLCDELPFAPERGLDGSPDDGLAARMPGVEPDLEAVVRMALARDPDRRYRSAGELVADLRRFVAREPVVARRPNVLHHIRLAVARRKTAVSAAVLAIAAVALAVGLGALRTTRVEARERARANQVTQFLKSVLALASPSQSPRADLTLREVLDDAARRIDIELADAPDARAEVHALVGSAWRELGQLERAEEHLRSAADVFRTTRPGSAELAGALSILSEVLLAQERGADAEAVLLEARELYTRDPDTPEFFLGIVTNKLAGAKRLQGQLDAAEPLAEEALAIYRRAFGESHVAVAGALGVLAAIQLDAGELEVAEHNAREALRIHMETNDAESLAVAQARVALGGVLLAGGRSGEACTELRAARPVLDRALPDGHAQRVRVAELIGRCTS